MSANAMTPAADAPRLPRWTNNLLVVAIGVTFGTLTLGLLPDETPPPVAAGAVARVDGAASAPDPLELGRGIVAAKLFGEVTVEAPAPAPKPVEPPRETRLNLQLAGVFAAEPQSQAIAIISAGSAEQNAYGVGDKITGETTLKAVYADHVILDNRGRDEILRLPDNVQPIALSPVQSVSPSSSGGFGESGGGAVEDLSQPIDLPSDPGQLRDHLARNPSLLGRVVAAEPYQENGKLVGYRIMPKQSPEILESQGILAGDVITRVNNIQLNSQKQGIRALRNAVKAESLDVVVLRDGIEVPISISLAR